MDISHTIIAKSDQLNAADLTAEGKLLQVTAVRVINSPDQPVIIHYVGDNGRPYKPCKSMRRVIVRFWGTDSSKYKGHFMHVYNDPEVTWAGQPVGGIRITGLSNCEPEKFDSNGICTTSLMIARGKSKRFPIKLLPSVHDRLTNAIELYNKETDENRKSKIESKAISLCLDIPEYLEYWKNSTKTKESNPQTEIENPQNEKEQKDA